MESEQIEIGSSEVLFLKKPTSEKWVCAVLQALHRHQKLLVAWISDTPVEELAQHPRCRFFSCHEDLQGIAWRYLFLKPCYLGDLEELSQAQMEVELLCSEHQDFGHLTLFNLLSNLPLITQSKQGLHLNGKAKGITAIVCGGGPSLVPVLPYLKRLQEQVLIIAGGSAIAALSQAQITPHLITGVDPDPSWTRFLEQNCFMTPFIYQARFSALQLQTLSSPLIFFPGSTSALEHYFFSSLPFDAGWSVLNFSTAIALHLGCSHIILAGADFCAPKDSLYAKGVLQDTHEELLLPYQKGLYTKKDWILSRKWTLDVVKAHPEVCFSKGPSLDPQLTLQEIDFSDLQLLPARDMQALVHKWTEELPVMSSEKSPQDLLATFKAAMTSCDKMLAIWQQHHPELPFDTPSYLEQEEVLKKTVCYTHYLHPLWQVWQFPLLRSEASQEGRRLHELLFFKTTLEKCL